MSFRRTLAIARKEFRHILRDLRTFFLVTVSPAFLLVMLSNIFAFDVQQANLAVWDLDGSALSRAYVATLTADGDLRLVEWVDSYPALDRMLLAGRADAGLVIPSGFEAELHAGRSVQVQAVIDGSDPLAAGQTSMGLEQRSAAFATDVAPARVQIQGLALHTEALYNPALESLIGMVPGLTAVVLAMPTLALALALAREKETGSFEGLVATPIRGIEYLVGKLAAYVICGLGSVVLTWLVAVFYFDVPFRGSLPTYLLLATVYLLASMGFSLVTANFVGNQQTAMFLVLMIFFVPSFFVAGLIAPLDTRNLASQVFGLALPTTHFIIISRGVFLKGLSLGALGLEAALLGTMGLGGLSISLLLFRKRVR